MNQAVRRHTSDRYEADAQEQPRAADERWARYRNECRDDQKRVGRSAEQARLKAEREIAIVQRRTLYLKQAEIRAQTDKAACQQDILTAQKKVVARQAQLTGRQLDTQVRKPARISLVKEAEADAQWARPTGEGEKAHRAALALRRTHRGRGQSAAISARGAAEAEEDAP